MLQMIQNRSGCGAEKREKGKGKGKREKVKGKGKGKREKVKRGKGEEGKKGKGESCFYTDMSRNILGVTILMLLNGSRTKRSLSPVIMHSQRPLNGGCKGAL